MEVFRYLKEHFLGAARIVRWNARGSTGNQISEKLGQMVRVLGWNVKRFKKPCWYLVHGLIGGDTQGIIIIIHNP